MFNTGLSGNTIHPFLLITTWDCFQGMDYTELFLGQSYFLLVPSIKDDFQSVLRSLRSNVYKHYKPHSMVCESMLLVTNHMPYL